MLKHPLISASAPTAARSARVWIFHLGALGFLPLGLIDNSLIPIPGSMDILVIALSAGKKELWIYYSLMATLGSILGGYVSYRLARKGGKEALSHRFPRKKLEKVYKIFEKWGFGAIAIPALLPPPAPMVPFLLVAGAMQYPLGKFLAALTAGRVIRYSILAYFAARYGKRMLALATQIQRPILIAAIGLIAIAVVAIIVFLGRKRKRRAQG